MRWYLVAIYTATVLVALILGIGMYTFYYAQGASYFSKDSKSCLNCHIMRDNYDSWSRSSHHHVTECNSCHMPKDFVAGYMSKAYNGFMHSYAFTTGDYHDPIRIKPINHKIVVKNCINCHQALFENENQIHKDKTISCLHCHQGIGHFR